MLITVFAIIGYDRCGKDYTARRLKKKFDELYGKENVVIQSLATPLKKITANKLCIDVDTLEKYKNDDTIVECNGKKMTARECIIEVGNSHRDKYGPAIFADMLIADILEQQPKIVIVPDMRFIAEANAFKTNPDLNVTIYKLISDLDTCGKNGIKYEVDDIEFDDILYNVKGG